MPEVTKAKQKGSRTCIGCGEQSVKVGLLRIVRLADGSVAFDPTGRAPGRGAYACSAECLRKALKSKKLQRALKATIQEEEASRIVSEVEAAAKSE